MRNMLLVLGLAGLAVAADVGDALARGRSGGSGGRSSSSVGRASVGRGNVGRAGYGNVGRGGYGNYGYGNGGYGIGGFGIGGYGGYGYGNGGYGNYGYGNGGYGGSYLPFGGAFLPYGGANLPDVTYGGLGYSPSYGDNYSPLQYQSNYPPQYPQMVVNGATLVVRVPDPNAAVWLQGAPMQEQGPVRQYQTAALDPNSNYSYTVRARWLQNGKAMDQTRQVPIHSGQTANVDFSNP